MTDQANTNPNPQAPRGEDDTTGKPRAIDLLQKIKAGHTGPTKISVVDRRLIVEMLMTDGATVPEIAKILDVSERTVKRDKQGIRAANAIERDPKLVGQMVGRLSTEVDTATQRIRRAIRDPRTTPAVKVDGEHRCYQILSDYFRHLQRIEFVPTAVQEIRGDLTHHFAEPPGLDELQQEVSRIEQIGRDVGAVDPQTTALIVEMRDQMARLALGEKLEKLSDAVAPSIETDPLIEDNET